MSVTTVAKIPKAMLKLKKTIKKLSEENTRLVKENMRLKINVDVYLQETDETNANLCKTELKLEKATDNTVELMKTTGERYVHMKRCLATKDKLIGALCIQLGSQLLSIHLEATDSKQY